MAAISNDSKIPMLKCGRDNNFVDWREEADIYCCAKFGMIASILVTDKEYVVPPVKLEDDEKLTEKVRTSLLAEAEKLRYRATMDLREVSGKFYATLITMLSYDSLMEVKQHDKFAEANGEKDPTKLVHISLGKAWAGKTI